MENLASALKLVGYGFSVLGPAFGIAIICRSANEGSARQPEVAGRLFTNFIVGAALCEALGLIAFVLAIIL